MAWLRRFAKACAVWVALSVLAVLVFSSVHAIVVISTLTLMVSVWLSLTEPGLTIAIQQTDHPRLIQYGGTLSVGVLFYFLGGSLLAKALYRTGTFGEPPDNRYADVAYVSPDRRDVVIEYGVHTYTLPGFRVGGEAKSAITQQDCWFATPHYRVLPPEDERHRGVPGELVLPTERDPRAFAFGVPQNPLTPEYSLYVYVRGDTDPVVLSRCYLRSNSELEGGEVQCLGSR